MKKAVLLIFLLLTASAIRAQVIVAPTILFMSSTSPFGTFMVMNKSLVPQEIGISFRFGFPESDSLGNTRMQYDDTLMAKEHSCQPWIRGFPQQFILNPDQEQIVRLLVVPPPGIPDGEYWTRIVTSSTPQAKTIDTVKTGITASITFVLQQVTTVVYKKGSCNTSVTMPEVTASPDSASMNLIAQVDRGGNSPFYGMMSAVVKDQADTAVWKDEQFIAVYKNNMFVKFSLPLRNLHSGTYTADLTMSSQRNDIPPEDLLKVPSVEKSIRFSVK